MSDITIAQTDVDGIQEAIETQKKNTAYRRFSNTMNTILRNTETKYLFAVYFDKDSGEMRYVLNGYTEDMEKHWEEEVHELGGEPKLNDFDDESVNQIKRVYEKKKPKKPYWVSQDAHRESLMLCYYPMYNSKKEVVCVLGVNISVSNISQKQKNFEAFIILDVSIVGILFLVVINLLMRKRVTDPIIKLANNSQCFLSQQNEKALDEFVFKSVGIHSGDELQLLSDSLDSMVSQLKSYTENIKKFTSEQERIETQFAVVQQLKENLFPVQFPAFQERTDFDILAKIKYSKIRSGDFFNFFLIDEKHFCFFAGTVTGSGVTTTMVAIIATIYIENYARLGYQPNRILAETNNQLSENNSGEITVSLFMGIADLDSGELTYAKVGDMPSLIKKSGDDVQVLECSTGFPLGSLENVVYAQHKIHLAQGESLLLYTKGMSERTDVQGYEYTDESVRKEWEQQLQTKYQLADMLDGMFQALESFAGEAKQEADETLLAFRYLGK